MAFTARHTFPSYGSLEKIADGIAARDRMEAAERKRLVVAFRAGVNPYEEAAVPDTGNTEAQAKPKFSAIIDPNN